MWTACLRERRKTAVEDFRYRAHAVASAAAVACGAYQKSADEWTAQGRNMSGYTEPSVGPALRTFREEFEREMKQALLSSSHRASGSGSLSRSPEEELSVSQDVVRRDRAQHLSLREKMREASARRAAAARERAAAESRGDVDSGGYGGPDDASGVYDGDAE